MFRNTILAAGERADRRDRANVRERGMDAAPAACLGQGERTRSGDHGAIRGWSPFRSAPDARKAIGGYGVLTYEVPLASGYSIELHAANSLVRHSGADHAASSNGTAVADSQDYTAGITDR